MTELSRKRLIEMLNINSRQRITNKPFFYNGLKLVARLIMSDNDKNLLPGIYVFKTDKEMDPIFKITD